MSDLAVKDNKQVLFEEDPSELLLKELRNIREELQGNKYIVEAHKVLKVQGYRSAIGSYWNAVVDDLRRKVMHRSLDLFNKEMSKNVKAYEDFQTHITDNDLIEGAYKIGVLSWEAKKMMHQARETRNIFDGHPDSTDPSLLKVLAMFADCNRYILSQEYPQSIINVNQYIEKMDTSSYNRQVLAIEQAFIDLPEVYKSELANKLYTYYIGDAISTTFRANIEFSFPILWSVLPKLIRQQLASSFEKKYLEGDANINSKGINLFVHVKGLRYLTSTTRKLIYEPKIALLQKHLDDWDEEAKLVKEIATYGSVVPDELIPRFVSALTLTFVGYKGWSSKYSRIAFYSNAAAPSITKMFESFDNKSVVEFIKTIKENETLKRRVQGAEQLLRLRALGTILLNKSEIVGDERTFLELLVDERKTESFYYELER